MNLRFQRVSLAMLLLALAGFAALNALAYRHARAMLHYAPGGARTEKPETLPSLAKLRVLLSGVNLPRPTDERPPAVLAPHARALAIDAPGGIRLSAWHAQNGEKAPLVIFFHGYSTEKTRLLREAQQIYAMGASVMLVDFRGSGGSSESYATLGMREAEDVAAAVRFARKHLPHGAPAIILYGQSMGSAAILRAIHTHGVQPDGVILESVFDSMLGTIRNRFAAMGLPAFPAAELLVFWGGRQFGFNGFAHNPVDYARALKCPALFLHGADDPRATLAEGRRVFEAAPAPKRFVAFDHVGHESYAARHPEPWRAAVRAFLAPFLPPPAE
ncbi:MAG: hypothetical protein EOM72_03075 [Opitutae bacterium]|nr:hypothetical protein [Opitutae bacterium]